MTTITMHETFSTERKRTLTPTGARRLLAKEERNRQHEAKGEGGGMGSRATREARRKRLGCTLDLDALREELGLN